MKHIILNVFCCGALFLTSCAIKEDRVPCPCVLELDFFCRDSEEIGNVDLAVTSKEDFQWRDTLDFRSEGEGYLVFVPRTELHLRAWSGAEGYISMDRIVIPLGEDCPRVYMHDSDLSIDEEYVSESVRLRKNYCVMTVVMEGEGEISSDILIKGNVAGYDETGEPLPGEFEYVMGTGNQSRRYVAVLPRQTDTSLMLEINDGKGNRKSFALGKYIASSGYDWTADELDDVTVTLDYALTELKLSISGWDGIYTYEIEI